MERTKIFRDGDTQTMELTEFDTAEFFAYHPTTAREILEGLATSWEDCIPENDAMLHGKEKMLPRVSSVETRPDYTMIITFKNGEQKLYDAKPMLDLPMYKNLRKVFSLARVEYGTVVWPQDMDISPDTLYLRGTQL